jgi:signal transduction histidine kinase
MQTEIQKYGIAVTKIFTQMANIHIFETDYVTVLEKALGLVKSSDIQSITIIDTNGKIWISTNNSERNPILMSPFYEDIVRNKKLKYRKIQKDAEWILEFVSPVTALGRVTHLVNVEISLKSMEKQLTERTQRILILSCVNITIAVLLAIALSKLLTGPIKNLVSGTNEISQGNLDYRINVYSQDEIGELSRSFNLMADNLQVELSERKHVEQELKKHHNQLEELVKERTAKLVRANREMELEIEERKQAEEALRESEEKLTRAKKMEALGLLAGGVAHDLNNVLSGIVSYPELLLLDLPEDSKLRNPIETMQASGHRAAAIVQDLLTVARGVATTREPLHLNEIVSDYLNSPEFKKLEKFYPTVTVKANIDTDLLNISGSHVHIRKVVMNLVSNASEAIEGSGNVTISTMNRYVDRPLRGYDDVNIGEYAVLAVSDDGPGISSDDLERIFEPFYTKKVMGRSGTGLGLAVVWNVVQDHKGYIDMITDENGSTFELYFPITREEISSQHLSIPIKDYKGSGETILVVDDVGSQRDISCRMLDKLGYKTKAESSGEEAVEYLKENTVDLIVLDMIMDPGINGLLTYERILKTHPKQKAIIVSGFAETDDVKKAQRLGAGQYIKKPITLEKIGIAVRDELKK